VKKIAIAMLAAGALATSFSPAANAAAPDPITDSGCSFTTATDPNPEAPANTQSGYLYGGPIAQNGTLKCTIKSGVATHTGTTPPGQSASLSGTGTTGVTVVAPGIVSYVSPPETDVYVCDQFTDSANVTYYWDGDNNVWTTSSAVNCELAIGAGTDDPIFDPINDLIESLDPLLCSTLLAPLNAVFGDPAGPVYVSPEGDLYVAGIFLWDCPPYAP
jgi:hypothetical protein